MEILVYKWWLLEFYFSNFWESWLIYQKQFFDFWESWLWQALRTAQIRAGVKMVTIHERYRKIGNGR
jgi:hypothetical protein